MKWISTTIKRIWLDKILSGEKKIERKVANDFWTPRLTKLMGETDVGLCLVCSRKVHRFEVLDISLTTIGNSFPPEDIDGVLTRSWFEIELGKEINKEGEYV